MTTERKPERLPDARWLLVAATAVFAIGLAVIWSLGPRDQRFARERQIDSRGPARSIGRENASPSTLPAVPPEVAAAKDEWPLPNGDYGNRRATTAATIDASNVQRLGVAWTRELRTGGYWGAAASGPLIAGGVVYFQDLRSNVFALDLKTGAPHWVAKLDQSAFGPNGPALGYGRVYAQDGDRHVVALDVTSGKIVWSAPLAGPTGQQQPMVYGGFVYTGIAAGRKGHGGRATNKTLLLQPGASGFAYGLHAADGSEAWHFQTVKPGFWGDPKLNAGGGIWMPAAVDTATGMTFWDTGNPVPAPGTVSSPNAASRPGPNLYTNSVLAVEGRTGRLRWYHQALPHDLLHHDLQNPPVLGEAGGRKLVIASGKMGIVYAYDRATGALVWQRPVGRHENDDLKAFPTGKGVQVYPGFWGGIETPLALAGGTIYALTEDMPTPYTATAWKAKDGHEAVQHLEGRTRYAGSTSLVVALDAATGRIRWQHRLPAPAFGATTVVNDLVFTATYDGVIYALARADGHVVWHFQAPGGINAWPAVAGNTIVWPVGLGRQPVLLALRLGATKAARDPKARPQAGTR
jgi:outer membrane protein assembly factor BamB